MDGATVTHDDSRGVWQLWLPNCDGPAAESGSLEYLEDLLDKLERQ